MLTDRKCNNCGTTYTDLYEKMEDSGAKFCNTCNREELVRVISAPGYFSINGYSYQNGYSNTGH